MTAPRAPQAWECDGTPGVRDDVSDRVGASLQMDVRNAGWLLSGVALFLALCSLGGQVSYFFLDHPTLLGFVERFNVTGEVTVPTWYTVGLLLLTSVALWIASRAERGRSDRRSARGWAGLSLLFLYLSVDDAAEIHELFATLFRRLGIGGEGYLAYPWVIAGIPFVLVLAVVFFRFVRTLPPRTRWILIGGAALFFGGAIGVEMIGANLAWSGGPVEGMLPHDGRQNPFSWQVVATVEELLEMLGVVVFLYGVLDYLHDEFGTIGLAMTRGSLDRR